MGRSCSVSVLVPVFNVEKCLRECLESIVQQTKADLQIICIDDGSADSSLDILKEYQAQDHTQDDRIEIVSKSNSGYGHSMSMGLESAAGELRDAALRIESESARFFAEEDVLACKEIEHLESSCLRGECVVALDASALPLNAPLGRSLAEAWESLGDGRAERPRATRARRRRSHGFQGCSQGNHAPHDEERGGEAVFSQCLFR